MRVAVIGAGIVGVTSAYELALMGHQVTVFERRSSIAAETSFANTGIISPGYVAPWAAPGMPLKVLGQLFASDSAVRVAGLPNLAGLRWLWRWWRACDAASFARHRAALLSLARESQQRLREITRDLQLDYEQAHGFLVLLRNNGDVRRARPALHQLAELGVAFKLVDAEACRAIEPGLHAATALQAGIHLADDGVGNCRQFALLLKSAAQRLGVDFRLRHEVLSIQPGTPVRLSVAAQAAEMMSTLVPLGADAADSSISSQEFDAVVACNAVGASALLAPLGLRLPLLAVHGYSITLPLRQLEAHPDLGPRAGLMDERYKVAISRIGDRVRVAGTAELFGAADELCPAPIATLYRVLEDWFPGAARRGRAQTWKGARPMLADGPPRTGASGLPGLWLNLGHGSSGWALACGSAARLAQALHDSQTMR